MVKRLPAEVTKTSSPAHRLKGRFRSSMMQKEHIVSTLGEERLLLPARLNSALGANDRAKYILTLLQSAKARAQSPTRWASDLRTERLSCGVTDEYLDEVVGACEVLADGQLHIPGASRIVERLFEEVSAMLVPLPDGGLAERLAQQRDVLKDVGINELRPERIDEMASADRSRGDSVHLVVMDAHKQLNRLQSEIATEAIDGASAYSLADADRPLVAAFMAGLNRTAPLKFDHPGLGTTATRVGERLVIQNDIGTTDAHVIVIHAEGNVATLTYTDVHLQRLLFFRQIFRTWAVEWTDARFRHDDETENGAYHLAVGKFVASDRGQLEKYLEYVGSRLVFLIDWNRARKRLRGLVPKAAAIELLTWAAENDVGHMAFLKAGGDQLVYDALRFAVRDQLSAGQPLSELLGESKAVEYLRFVMRRCTDALLHDDTGLFLQDSIRAELLNHVRSGRQNLFDVVSEHAAWVVELASAVRDCVMRPPSTVSSSTGRALARRAKDWESKADMLVNRIRNAQRPGDASEFFRELVEAADDVADELEDAIFHLTLLPADAGQQSAYPPLRELGHLLVQGAQEYVKAVETARHVRRTGSSEDTTDFLEAVHRITLVERRSDEAQREVEIALAQSDGDFRALYMTAEAAKNLEQAADALMHCSLKVRDYMMREVLPA